jgi:hypothetical protein
VLLAADDPVEADRQSSEVMQRWWHGGFTRQHYNHVLGRGVSALYRGDAAAAWKMVMENRVRIRRALLLRIQVVRIELAYLLGRSALAMAAATADDRPGKPARRRFLAIARREAKRLAREGMLWSDAFSRLLDAGVAYLEGDGRLAEQRLVDAVAAFEQADMKVYAAGARRRLGLLQGDRGRALLRDAEELMTSQAIRNPRFMTRMIAPGFPDQ